jgi:hypothetical protein
VVIVCVVSYDILTVGEDGLVYRYRCVGWFTGTAVWSVHKMWKKKACVRPNERKRSSCGVCGAVWVLIVLCGLSEE